MTLPKARHQGERALAAVSGLVFLVCALSVVEAAQYPWIRAFPVNPPTSAMCWLGTSQNAARLYTACSPASVLTEWDVSGSTPTIVRNCSTVIMSAVAFDVAPSKDGSKVWMVTDTALWEFTMATCESRSRVLGLSIPNEQRGRHLYISEDEKTAYVGLITNRITADIGPPRVFQVDLTQTDLIASSWTMPGVNMTHTSALAVDSSQKYRAGTQIYSVGPGTVNGQRTSGWVTLARANASTTTAQEQREWRPNGPSSGEINGYSQNVFTALSPASYEHLYVLHEMRPEFTYPCKMWRVHLGKTLSGNGNGFEEVSGSLPNSCSSLSFDTENGYLYTLETSVFHYSASDAPGMRLTKIRAGQNFSVVGWAKISENIYGDSELAWLSALQTAIRPSANKLYVPFFVNNAAFSSSAKDSTASLLQGWIDSAKNAVSKLFGRSETMEMPAPGGDVGKEGAGRIGLASTTFNGYARMVEIDLRYFCVETPCGPGMCTVTEGNSDFWCAAGSHMCTQCPTPSGSSTGSASASASATGMSPSATGASSTAGASSSAAASSTGITGMSSSAAASSSAGVSSTGQSSTAGSSPSASATSQAASSTGATGIPPSSATGTGSGLNASYTVAPSAVIAFLTVLVSMLASMM